MIIAQRPITSVEETSPTRRSGAEPKFAGRTLTEWDADWTPVKGGFTVLHSELASEIGLFRADLGGTIMYIGKAVEVDNGGLRKRLSDFSRPSPSAREHHGGMRNLRPSGRA